MGQGRGKKLIYLQPKFHERGQEKSLVPSCEFQTAFVEQCPGVYMLSPGW